MTVGELIIGLRRFPENALIVTRSRRNLPGYVDALPPKEIRLCLNVVADEDPMFERHQSLEAFAEIRKMIDLGGEAKVDEAAAAAGTVRCVLII